ncbi:hypothetical protein [Rhodococcus sp. NBC_00297]|uniref:hypothetical protein n=1 Tax=Rhodococcus sp. NBC_00297 TaxID=2976005 RepID=UPI002E2A2BE4|nr:hypothetical protein [Rhodococcus sp. NBC_00297]
MTGPVSQLALFGDAVGTNTTAPAPPTWTWRPLKAPMPETTIRRFRAKVVVTPGCHYFVGAVSNPDGYGRFTFTDYDTPRTLSAHRVSLLLVHGDLGDGVVGEHDCDETLCVRVGDGHLKLGTQASNLAHAVAVGRHFGPAPAGGDPRGRYGRAVAIRDALTGGYDERRLHAVLAAPTVASTEPTLF